MPQVFKKTKLSIVVPVLNSHGIVRRQIVHYKRMNLPDDIEIIFIDDNSDPPLRGNINTRRLRNFHIYPTGDTRPWTIACARNLGAKIAQGEYIFNTDIDHILPYKAIMEGYKFTGDKLMFEREYGILDNKGMIRQSHNFLLKYGANKSRLRRRGTHRYYHVGTHVIRKQILMEIDGYPLRCCEYGSHPTREDRLTFHRYLKHAEVGKCKPQEMANDPVLVFPVSTGKLFHNLPRKKKF